MSKIGKKAIIIPDGVEVSFKDQTFTAKGEKGEMEAKIHPLVDVDINDEDSEVKVTVKNPSDRKHRAMWGTMRSVIEGVITGVKNGYEKRLKMIGVGYKAQVQGDKLTLNVGYSHPIEMMIPKGLEIKVEKDIISVSGINKQKVGQFSAEIRATRKPEPYKGKGIRYEDEQVRRKAGKVVKAVSGAGTGAGAE